MALPGITCPNTQENLVLESFLQPAVCVVGKTHEALRSHLAAFCHPQQKPASLTIWE